MPLSMSITLDGITRSVAFESAPNMDNVIGNLDRLLRGTFPDRMHNKNLGLNRHSTMAPRTELMPIPTTTGRYNLPGSSSRFSNVGRDIYWGQTPVPLPTSAENEVPSTREQALAGDGVNEVELEQNVNYDNQAN